MNGLENNDSNKKMVVAALLCFFLGMIGVHRFYVGKFFFRISSSNFILQKKIGKLGYSPSEISYVPVI